MWGTIIWLFFTHFQAKFLRNLASEIINFSSKYVVQLLRKLPGSVEKSNQIGVLTTRGKELYYVFGRKMNYFWSQVSQKLCLKMCKKNQIIVPHILKKHFEHENGIKKWMCVLIKSTMQTLKKSALYRFP